MGSYEFRGFTQNHMLTNGLLVNSPIINLLSVHPLIEILRTNYVVLMS